MKRIILNLILVISLLVFPPRTVLSQEEAKDRIVDVDCGALIINGNTSLARKSAISDAMRKAVVQTAEDMLSGAVATGDVEAAKESIVARAQEYIRDYRILSENVSDGVYGADIKVTVVAALIEKDLRSMGMLEGGPAKPQPEPVTLHLRGIRNYADYAEFREFIKGYLRDVEAYRERRIGPGGAEIELDVRGGVPRLVSELEKAKQFPARINILGEHTLEVIFLR